jgi:protein gp37
MPTNIEWCDETINPVVGCSRISDGCRNCYAARWARRLKSMGLPQYRDVVTDKGEWTGKVSFVPSELDKPLRWKKPLRIFVGSMCDLFHEDVPIEVLHEIFGEISICQRHIYMVLTKRPNRMLLYSKTADFPCGLLRQSNAWLGVTIENQSNAWRADVLRRITAAKRFVSVEPMLGPVDFRTWLGLRRPDPIHWVICGCETGPGRRPCKQEWIDDLREQCRDAGVPFFLKKHEVNGKIVAGEPREVPE